MRCPHLTVNGRRRSRKSSLRDVIDSARCICKKLRNPSVFVFLIKLKLRKPILDNPTRLHSTYGMLQRLLLLKDFCFDMAASNPNSHLPETFWNSFSMFVEILEPAKIATNPAYNAMQAPYGPCKGCSYETRTNLAAGAAVAPHGLTARVSCSSNYLCKLFLFLNN